MDGDCWNRRLHLLPPLRFNVLVEWMIGEREDEGAIIIIGSRWVTYHYYTTPVTTVQRYQTEGERVYEHID